MSGPDSSKPRREKRPSQRRQAKETLRQARFSIDVAPDCMFWMDSDGSLIDVSQSACRRLGYSRDEMLTMSVFDFTVGHDSPEVWSDHVRVLREGGPLLFEEQYRTRSGEVFPVEINSNLFEHEGREQIVGIVRDISERKAAEKALRLTEFSVNRVADMMSWTSREGRFLFVNDTLCRNLGYTRAELLGLTVWEVDPNILESWDERWLESKRSGPQTFESTHRTKSGEVFPVEVTTNFIEYEGQEYLVSFSRDVTERKQAEEALRDEISRRRILVEQSRDGIVVLDPNGKVVEANEAYARMLGYSLEEVYQLHIWDWNTHIAKEELLGMLEEVDESGDHFETRHLRKDGTQCEVEISSNGAVYGGEKFVFCVCRDITERKQAEEWMRELAVRQQAILAAVPDILMEVDNDKVYRWANHAGLEFFGEDVIGREAAFYFEGGQDTYGVVAPLFNGREDLTYVESWQRRKDGETRLLAWLCRGLQDGTGNVMGAISSALDITERKQAEETLRQSEEQLRQSQKMEAVGQLAGGIAHDFNNLLTAILGYSNLLLDSADLPDPARADLREIKQAAERAGALTKQILAFSRRQALRPDVVSLNEVLSAVESLLRRTLGENIDLVSLPHPGLGLAEIDVHQFEQVIMNLALNARDAMPAGGRLTLETANVELDEEFCRTRPQVTPGRHVMLAVSDTGFGMDEATLAHVFEPFFTTKALGEGTGLGLATAYGIVKQSRGNIFVYSQPGQGTTFKIYLPRVATHEAAETVVLPEHIPSSGSEKIMVVEDESSLRSLIERVLAGAGYEVTCFVSADEALIALEQGQIEVDLLLTDVVLPGMLQGKDLVDMVKVSRPDLPVLYMSGYTRDAIVHAGRLDEGVNFLEKPFTPVALARMVREVLDRPHGQG